MQTETKPYRGMAMEGFVARWYARATAIDQPDLERLAQRIAAPLHAGSRILEVAPGPGYLAITLAKHGMRLDGIDISQTFVDIAIDTARNAPGLPPATSAEIRSASRRSCTDKRSA